MTCHAESFIHRVSRRLADSNRWKRSEHHVHVSDPQRAMTEREALVQLATPEPDYHDNPALWQEWRDRTTEALTVARAFTASLTGAA